MHDGSGGDGDTPSLAAAPSLYLTGWSLQLAAATNTATPNIDRARVTHWLEAGTTNPGSFTADTGLPVLTRIQLAASAIKALGATPPRKTANTIEALRAGPLYRDSQNSAPNWASTAVAVQTLSDLDDPIPAQVLSGAAAHATELSPSMSFEDIDQTGLPILEVLATQQAAVVVREVPQLATLLRAWSASIRAKGPSAVGVGDLAAIRELALKAEVTAPVVPASFLLPLRAQDGYYALGLKAATGDPQVTFDAVVLGAPLSDQARALLARGQISTGWLASESPPTPDDTYDANVIDQLCGGTTSNPLSPQLLASWIATATSSQTESSRGSSSILAEVCWLARDLHISLPSSAMKSEESAISAWLRADASQPAAGADLAAASACALTVPTTLLSLLAHALEAATARSMTDIFDIYLAGIFLKSEPLIAHARSAAAALRTAQGVYRYSSATTTPDLISTAEAFVVCSPLPAADRLHALADFASPSGPSLSPPATDHAGSDPIVTLSSLAAATVLDSATSDPQYLL